MIAWNRHTHKSVWETTVGVHRNDTGPLPQPPGDRLPGAVRRDRNANGLRIRPCVRPGRQPLWMEQRHQPPERCHHSTEPPRPGGVRRTRRCKRTCSLGSTPTFPDFGCATAVNNVVFTSTWAGIVYAFAAKDGKLLWHARMPAKINACPAIDGNQLLIGAGVPRSLKSATDAGRLGLPSTPHRRG